MLGIFPIAKRGMIPRPHRALKSYLDSDTLDFLGMPWYLEKPILNHVVARFLGAETGVRNCNPVYTKTTREDIENRFSFFLSRPCFFCPLEFFFGPLDFGQIDN